MKEIQRREREEAIRYWRPHAKQLEFVRSGGKTRVVLGGNRSGKSESGCIEAVSHALGRRLYLAEDDPAYKIDVVVPNRGRICGEDYRNHIGNVIVPKLRKWIPAGELQAIKKNPQGLEVLFIFKNGSTIELMTYEQESDKFEGSDNDWVWFDEPPPRDVYIAATRGLIDRDGRHWLTMTPLKEPWVSSEIWAKREDSGSGVEGFIFDIRDNIGYGLTEEAVLEFEKKLTEEEKESRLRGRFMHLTGLVYKEFSYKMHVVDPFEIPEDWAVYVAIDPHPRTPHAVLFLAVDPHGTKYVTDELFRACLISELAEMIRAKLGSRRPRSVLIDPSATAPNPISGVTMQTEFTKHKIYAIPGSKELGAGIQRVKRALKPVMEGGAPELYIFSTCKETIYEFNNYIWDEWRGRERQKREAKNRPRDKDDHMMENLYRLLLHNPRYSRSYMRFGQMEYEARNPITGY